MKLDAAKSKKVLDAESNAKKADDLAKADKVNADNTKQASKDADKNSRAADRKEKSTEKAEGKAVEKSDTANKKATDANADTRKKADAAEKDPNKANKKEADKAKKKSDTADKKAKDADNKKADAQKNSKEAKKDSKKAKKESEAAKKKSDTTKKKSDSSKKKAKEAKKKDKLAANRNASTQEQQAWKIFKKHSNDPKRKKPPKKNSEDESMPHLDGQALVKGNLAKGAFLYKFTPDNILSTNANYYSYNAWHFIGSVPAGDVRDIYNKKTASAECYSFFDKEFTPNFNQKYSRKKINKEENDKLIALLTHGVPNPLDDTLQYAVRVDKEVQKKTGTIGQALPYDWQAHHILPMNCFLKFFTDNEISIILRSYYDINSGENMIFLPEEEGFTKYHKLPYHSSDHKKYNTKIKKEFKIIRKTIQEMKNEPHKAVDVKIEKDLHEMELDNYEYISNFGISRLN